MNRSALDDEITIQEKKSKPFRVPSKVEIWAQSVLAGLCVALFSSVVEELVGEAHVHASRISTLDQLTAGLVAAVCVYILRYHSRKRRLLDRQRFELIAASTQQIRDALQLITDTAIPGSQQQQVVLYAVDHIEWVLQEVLPTVHQDPKEVRARLKEYE